MHTFPYLYGIGRPAFSIILTTPVACIRRKPHTISLHCIRYVVVLCGGSCNFTSGHYFDVVRSCVVPTLYITRNERVFTRDTMMTRGSGWSVYEICINFEFVWTRNDEGKYIFSGGTLLALWGREGMSWEQGTCAPSSGRHINKCMKTRIYNIQIRVVLFCMISAL